MRNNSDSIESEDDLLPLDVLLSEEQKSAASLKGGQASTVKEGGKKSESKVEQKVVKSSVTAIGGGESAQKSASNISIAWTDG